MPPMQSLAHIVAFREINKVFFALQVNHFLMRLKNALIFKTLAALPLWFLIEREAGHGFHIKLRRAKALPEFLLLPLLSGVGRGERSSAETRPIHGPRSKVFQQQTSGRKTKIRPSQGHRWAICKYVQSIPSRLGASHVFQLRARLPKSQAKFR